MSSLAMALGPPILASRPQHAPPVDIPQIGRSETVEPYCSGVGGSGSGDLTARKKDGVEDGREQTSSSPGVFEFTERHARWADLLIHELSEAIILVLSPAGQIWYCGNAIYELLGWRDGEVVDRLFTDLISRDDKLGFEAQFRECICQRSNMLTYVRMKCKPNPAEDCKPPLSSAIHATRIAKGDGPFANSTMNRDILFELTGYPHFVFDPSEDVGMSKPKCFFVMAKPYPCRSTVMINAFLELKLENTMLQDKVNRLKARSPCHSDRGGVVNTFLVERPQDMRSTPYGDERAAKKPKLQWSTETERRVCTCGRTESPEWRRGPLGPKTLCNACGLAWAKQMKQLNGKTSGKSTKR